MTGRDGVWEADDIVNLFFLSGKAQIFFPEFNIRLYDRHTESDYFFFPPPKSEYFVQQHWEKITKLKDIIPLKMRIMKSIAIETFKIVNKQSSAYLHDLIQIKQNKYSYR